MGNMKLVAIIVFAVFLVIYLVVAILDVIRNKKRGNKYRFSVAVTAFLFLLPACVLTFYIVLLPIIYSLSYGFTNYKLGYESEITWNNFKNFEWIFTDFFDEGSQLADGLRNTAIFVGVVTPLQIGLALGLALFCNANMKFNKIFRVCFFAPVVISLSVTSYLWMEILASGDTGLLNSILHMFGIESQFYLTEDIKAIIWVAFISAWQGCGFQMLIFISALGGIRKELYEAARMDGCNAIQRFFKVTLPGLRPTLVYILVTVFIGACRILVQPRIMIGYHSPGYTLSFIMYEEGVNGGLIGYASALALIMTVVIGTITFIQRKILGGNKQ